MEKYKIEIKKSAVRELNRLPKKDLKPVISRIKALADNPRPPNSKKLCADEKYRIRQGNYRILYEIADRILIVYVVKIAHRKEAYRKQP